MLLAVSDDQPCTLQGTCTSSVRHKAARADCIAWAAGHTSRSSFSMRSDMSMRKDRRCAGGHQKGWLITARMLGRPLGLKVSMLRSSCSASFRCDSSCSLARPCAGMQRDGAPALLKEAVVARMHECRDLSSSQVGKSCQPLCLLAQ